MKTYRIAVVVTAVLMVAAGVGIGIALAEGNPSDGPAWSIQEQIETGNLPEPTMGPRSQQDFVPEDNYSGTDWQVAEPVETGSVPDMREANDLDHTDIPREGNVYRYWGADNPSN